MEVKNKIEVSKDTEQKLIRINEIRGADVSNDFLMSMALEFWLSKNDPARKYAKKSEVETPKNDSNINNCKKVEKLNHGLVVANVSNVAKERLKVQAGGVTLLSKNFGGQSRYIPARIKKLVFRRDGFSCQKCGSRKLLQLDHIIPFKNNGKNTPENLRVLCSPCNRAREMRLQ